MTSIAILAAVGWAVPASAEAPRPQASLATPERHSVEAKLTPFADRLRIVRRGSGPVTTGPAPNFAGTATVSAPFSGKGASRISGATVTFDRGARSAWHRHALGQTLVVTDGCGWVQREGASIETFCAGDVAVIAPGEKHWHGATSSMAMSHVALSEGGVQWLEQVSDEEYAHGHN